MFKNIEYYKPDINKTISHISQAYEDAYNKKVGNVTFRALPPVDNYFEDIDLTKYNFKTDIEKYADDITYAIMNSCQSRKLIDDNFIPAITPVLGIGDYSAFVTGEIIFKKDTSWSQTHLNKLSDYKNLPQLGTAIWYERFLNICEALLKRVADYGIPFMRGFFSPLDLASALRGENLYLDFYDDPDGVHELLNYCACATIQFAEDIYSLASKYLKKTKYGMWFLEGNINMSEDISCMLSPKIYREFEAPHTQRVINHFGRGHMHCHSRAMYLVKEICSLDNVVSLWLPTDPNQHRPIDDIKSLNQDTNGVYLAIDCTEFEEIERSINELRKGNYSVCLPVKGVEEGILLTERFNRL